MKSEIKREYYYRSKFKNPTEIKIDVNGKILEKGRATVCGLILKENPNELLMGVSYCNHKDPFRKVVGRGLSKSRALKKEKVLIIKDLEDKQINYLFISESKKLI